VRPTLSLPCGQRPAHSLRRALTVAVASDGRSFPTQRQGYALAIGDVNPSSFEAYEGIRMLIPGAVAVSLYGGVVATFSLSIASPADNALAAAVGALFVGLILLFVDAPVKSAAYRNRYLPNREIEDWNVDTKPYRGALNLYFVMLDTSFPATIRNRGLYMGSVFRIGFEGIYLIALTALGVLVTTSAFPDLEPARPVTTATRVVLYVAAASSALIFAASLYGRLLYRSRQTRELTPRAEVWKELKEDIRLDGLAFAIVAAVLFAVFWWKDYRPLGITAVALPIAYWAVVYFIGRPQLENKKEPRRALSPPAASFLYGVPFSIACVECALRVGHGSPLDTSTALAWAVVALLTGVLIASRGHERKLIGSFQTQVYWMRNNRSTLLRDYNLKSLPPEDAPTKALGPGR
jgi:hypothetical protein